MKVINKGNPQSTTWWIGKIITCDFCRFSAELESGDIKKHNQFIEIVDQFFCQCPNCNASIKLKAQYD